jgi:negative regulator of sigma E activity
MTEGQRPAPELTHASSERDSQLSAMFDGELSAAECELLARRLARDEALRAQWSRFALIGAALRAERGVKLHERVANRVQAALAQEPAYGDSAAADGAVARPAAAAGTASGSVYEGWQRFARPLVGASIAAGVAAVSILWLRTQEADPALVADAATPASIVLQPEAAPQVQVPSIQVAAATDLEPVSNGEPERYVTPVPNGQTSIAPPARFANYVVAHSEVSGPLARRMALLGIVGTEGTEALDQTQDKDENRPPETAQPANREPGRADPGRANQARGTVNAP